MASLGDKLLSAGLIDRKAKQAADAEARRAKKKKPKAQRAEQEAARQAGWEEARAAQAAENRQREALRREARELKETQDRVVHLVRVWAVRELHPGNNRWCFVSRSNRIRWLLVGAEVAERLTAGSLAIVERPDDANEPFALVPRHVAERIAGIDPSAVRFWNRGD